MRFSLSSLLALTFVLGSLGTLYNTWDSWQITKRLHTTESETLQWLHLSGDGKFLSAKYRKLNSIDVIDPKTKTSLGALLPERIYVWNFPDGKLLKTYDNTFQNSIREFSERIVRIPDGDSRTKQLFLDLDTLTTRPVNLDYNIVRVSHDGRYIVNLIQQPKGIKLDLIDTTDDKVLNSAVPALTKISPSYIYGFFAHNSRFTWLSEPTEIKIWTPPDQIKTYTLPNYVIEYSPSFSNRGSLFVVLNKDPSNSTIIDVKQHMQNREIPGEFIPHPFSQNERWMLALPKGGKIGEALTIWDLKDATPRAAWTTSYDSNWLTVEDGETNWLIDHETLRMFDPSHKLGSRKFPYPAQIQHSAEDGALLWIQAKKWSSILTEENLELWETWPASRKLYSYGIHTDKFVAPRGSTTFAAEQSLGDFVIWSKMRPEPLWGIVWLPAFWTTLITLGFLGWCVRKDFKGLSNKR